MTGICFELGLTEDDVAQALRSLSPRLAANTPVLALGGQHAGAPRQAVFASAAIMRLFGATTLAGLSERIGSAARPGAAPIEAANPAAERLRELSETLPLNGPARLERLRFGVGGAPRAITFLCRRLAVKGAPPLFLAAALDSPAYRSDARAAVVSDSSVPGGLSPATDPAASKQDGRENSRYATGFEEIRTRLSRSRRTGADRFLWRTDADGQIVEIGPRLREVIGGTSGDLLGRRLFEAAARFDAQTSRRLAQLMERKESWAGVEIDWPVAGSSAIVPITLAASPSFDPQRRFLGFRGFGLIHLDRFTASRAHEPAAGPEAADVVPLPEPARGERGAARPEAKGVLKGALSPDEQLAFRAIASTLSGVAPPAGARARGEATKGSADQHEPSSGLTGQSERVPAGPQDLVEISLDEAAAFDALPIGILMLCDGAPAFANRFLLDCLGCVDLRGAEAIGAIRAILQRLPNLTQGDGVELRDSSGKPVSLRMRREDLRRGSKKAELVSLLARHDTPRPNADAELRHYQREARELNAILDTAMDGVAVLDAEGRILALNRSGEALFCYDKAEVAGEPFTALIAPESRERAQSYFEGLKSNGVASLLNDGREILGLTRQGGVIPIFMTLGKVGAGSNAASDQRFCALLRDMTHWKKVERELEEARQQAERASALKSDFLAKVSHEIRTPLNAILGFAEVIMEERFGPIGNDRYKDYLKDIHSSGALVMSLVNDLLDLSKIEAGKMELSFESVDVNRIVTECVSIMQPQASRARVIMRLSLAPQLPHIFADERSLRQIVLNLLSNAIKFTQAGGQVIISTALTDANHAALRIRDTGVGMSEDDVEVALEPFRQISSSHVAGGTGLGLPLTKALVEANRASFSIKSKLHEGTLVEVAFPPARVVADRT
ncbi:conserved hypothetical protein [Methylocella tundrae]|uniref:histidine kinase n=1 Tax=Methylocella tundrae TaxID=227605 RepID=A0A8B6M1B1_METTU|nr:ATP-binding protein [Methylocella tundrae]VTZ48636.1 conserved hypothetical protein [Methylocella tundrae]